MSQPRWITGSLLLGISALALWSVVVADDDTSKTKPQTEDNASKEADKKDLNHFMRLKLQASGKVLEGLATEDFGLIQEGAKKLNEMSTAEKWRVSNDALYRHFSSDFQKLTKDLETAAKNENLDRAVLKWMDATLSCIECHRYTRGVLFASLDTRSEGRP